VETAAKAVGFTVATLRRAREKVCDTVKTGRPGQAQQWEWILRRPGDKERWLHPAYAVGLGAILASEIAGLPKGRPATAFDPLSDQTYPFPGRVPSVQDGRFSCELFAY
jgi:hypothetical protein